MSVSVLLRRHHDMVWYSRRSRLTGVPGCPCCLSLASAPPRAYVNGTKRQRDRFLGTGYYCLMLTRPFDARRDRACS